MKIITNKKLQIVGVFFLGLVIGRVNFTEVFYNITDSDNPSIASMGADYSYIKINDSQTKTYINDKYGFEIVYPKDFTVLKEENAECLKTSYVDSEFISNPVVVRLKEGDIIDLVPVEFNSSGDYVFSGSMGYRYLPDCNPSRFISIGVRKKISDLDTYIDGIVSFHKNRNEEIGVRNSVEEGPFRLVKRINGKNIKVLRFKTGNGFMDITDIYFFENENYIYELSNLYNEKNLISPDTQDDYTEQLREYELALRVIKGFSLQKENKN